MGLTAASTIIKNAAETRRIQLRQDEDAANAKIVHTRDLGDLPKGVQQRVRDYLALRKRCTELKESLATLNKIEPTLGTCGGVIVKVIGTDAVRKANDERERERRRKLNDFTVKAQAACLGLKSDVQRPIVEKYLKDIAAL